MSKRIWLIRTGDHFFSRNVYDLYESLAERYTQGKEPRGILAIFPENLKSPFWKRQSKAYGQHRAYFKDKESVDSFTKPLAADAELKIYIAAHGGGEDKIRSLEDPILNPSLSSFSVSAETLADQLDELLKQVQFQPTTLHPLTISLIVCNPTQAFNKQDTFAHALLKNLMAKGYTHILIKARAGLTPVPILGKKNTIATKEHFYSDGQDVYHVDKENDFRWDVLKILKKCVPHTAAQKVAVAKLMATIESMGYHITIAHMKALQAELKRYEVTIRECLPRTSCLSMFNLQSIHEKKLDALLTQSSFYPYKTANNFVKKEYAALAYLKETAAAPFVVAFLNKLINRIENNLPIQAEDKAAFAALTSDHFEPEECERDQCNYSVRMLRNFLNLFTLLFTLGYVNKRNYVAETIINKPYFFPPTKGQYHAEDEFKYSKEACLHEAKLKVQGYTPSPTQGERIREKSLN